jgi:membrane fusion protein (multidrug efflux system)
MSKIPNVPGSKDNTLIPIALIASLPLLSGCKDSSTEPSRQTAPPLAVQIIQPRHGPITRFVTLPAEIRPYQEATLYAKVAGYLKTITVDKGDRVKDGDFIADIEVPEMLADILKYKAEVEAADLDFKRLSESQKKLPDLVVPQTVDNARAKLDVAKANLDRTQTLLNYAKITAPFSGIITKRNVDPGAFIPAATSGTAAQNAAIVTVTDLNRIRVQVAVPELESSLIETNQPIKLSVDGLPGRSFEGKITRYSYSLDQQSKTMLAEIELPNPSLELRPGMYATVKIGIEHKDDTLLVPTDALLVEKAGNSVFTVVENKARKTPVKTGFNDGTNAEIISGIKSEQPVVLIGKKTIADGQPIQPEPK